MEKYVFQANHNYVYVNYRLVVRNRNYAKNFGDDFESAWRDFTFHKDCGNMAELWDTSNYRGNATNFFGKKHLKAIRIA